MRYPIRKLNNQGSTLLTVIICLALIGILGSMMLSVTMTNLQMKIVDSKSKENFYSGETAMEEIRTGLAELTAEKIREVYETKVLVNYSDYLNKTDAEKNLQIQNMVAVRILRELGNITISVPDQDVLNAVSIQPVIDSFTGYLSITDNPAAQIDIEVGVGPLSANTEGNSVLIRDISIAYSKEDYKTTITSDIRIDIPVFTFDKGTEITHYNMEPLFQDYTLLADGGISSVNDTGANTIQGSVYAGAGGITIDSVRSGLHEVIMGGDNIVTRGNLTVADTAKLTVNDYFTADGTHKITKLWADNLLTYTSDAYPAGSALPTTIDLNGISIIKDDLTLEGRNSIVRLSGGYVGYTGTHTAEGSSIIINGSGSSLDLSGLTSLILAGRAHVSVEDNVLNKDADILTGESVALKSNQRAYLIPGKFIDKILHNPVTKADVDTYGLPKVVFTTPDAGEIDYEAYVAVPPLNTYKIAAMQTGDPGFAATLRYYYLNFASGKLADAYLKQYWTKYPDLLNAMEPFALGSIKLPPVEFITSVGNLMTYKALEGELVKLTDGLSGSYGSDTELDTFIAAKKLSDITYTNAGIQPDISVGVLAQKYSQISHLLTLEGTAKTYQETDQVVDSAVITGGVDFILNQYKTKPAYEYHEGAFNYINPDSGLQVKLLVKGNTTLENSSFLNGLMIVKGDVTIASNATVNGLVVATGNINIADHATINGMLISTGETGAGNINTGNGVVIKGRLAAAGNISLGTNCNIKADETYLTPIFADQGELLRNLFKNAVLTVNFIEKVPAENLVDISNMIYYENWNKN